MTQTCFIKEEATYDKEKKVVLTSTSYEEKLTNYVKMHSPVVCILTPTYGSVVFVNYMVCLIKTIQVFEKYGIKVVTEFCRNDSLVTRARNNLIAKAMTKKDVTHVMFIDADITWSPMDIVKLMLSDKALVGGLYPLKTYNFQLLSDPQFLSNLKAKRSSDVFRSIIGDVTDEQMVRYNLVRYNFNANSSQVVNNLLEVRHIATGFMMMKRSMLETMMRAYPETKYVDDVGFLTTEESENAYTLFDCAIRDTHYLSEDWYFCDRFTKIGGQVYVDISIALTHTGVEDFQGNFASSILG